MPTKPNTTDEYLKSLSEDKRAALEKLRKTIKTVVPKAEECISYGLPAFQVDGTVFAGFSASTKHCSYFPMSGSVVDKLKEDLKDYDTSKGTIRFTIDDPLPATLIRKLVKARLDESKERKAKKAK